MNTLYAETKHGRFHYWPFDEIGQTIAAGNFWDEHFKPYIDRLDAGSLLVDVGANIGFFTIYAALRGVYVMAFEPSPEVFTLLEENVRANGVELNCSLKPCALFDTETCLQINPDWDPHLLPDGKFEYETTGNSGGLSLVKHGRVNPQYKFEARTLDSFGLGWRVGMDMIKVDTQGADLRVLVGARKTIERIRPLICFEFEEVPAARNGDTLEDYMRFFDELDYKVTKVGGNRPDYSDFVAEAR